MGKKAQSVRIGLGGGRGVKNHRVRKQRLCGRWVPKRVGRRYSENPSEHKRTHECNGVRVARREPQLSRRIRKSRELHIEKRVPAGLGALLRSGTRRSADSTIRQR